MEVDHIYYVNISSNYKLPTIPYDNHCRINLFVFHIIYMHIIIKCSNCLLFLNYVYIFIYIYTELEYIMNHFQHIIHIFVYVYVYRK